MQAPTAFLSPRAHLDQVLTLFTDRLRPFVNRAMEHRYGQEWFEHPRSRQLVGGPALRGPSQPPHLDCQACLKLIEAYWKPIFQHSYRGDRVLLRVIRQLRNEFAHQELITDESVIYAASACSKCLRAFGLSTDGFQIPTQDQSLAKAINRAQLGDLLLWSGLGGTSILLLLASSALSAGQPWELSWRLLALTLLTIMALASLIVKTALAPRAKLGVRERWLSAGGGSALGISMAAGYGLVLPMAFQQLPTAYGLDLRWVLAVVLGGLGSMAGQRLGVRRGLLLVMVVGFSMAVGGTLGFLLVRNSLGLQIGLWTGNLCAYAGLGLCNALFLLPELRGPERWLAAGVAVVTVLALLRALLG